MRLYPSRKAAAIRKQRDKMEEEEPARDQRATKEEYLTRLASYPSALSAVACSKCWSEERRFEAGLQDRADCLLCGQPNADDLHKFWTCPELPSLGLEAIQKTQDSVPQAVQECPQNARLWLRGI
eukprot:7247590-Pyramimonas_sp.AAC.1